MYLRLLAEIVDNSSLHLDFNVFEKDLPMLKVGQTIHFTLTNNPTRRNTMLKYIVLVHLLKTIAKPLPVHCAV
jgi:cobalt-zinc-cadmium efflux system membrane fusion protein